MKMSLIRQGFLLKSKPNGFVAMISRRYAQVEHKPSLDSDTMPDPEKIQHDYIGPPDKLSNLRPILRHKPAYETRLQEQLRLRRVEVQEWNQKFWANHNQRFYEDKTEFIRLNKKTEEGQISADDMSKFYKYFLDKNRKMHMMYNFSWYLKNVDILLLATQVKIESLYRKLRRSK